MDFKEIVFFLRLEMRRSKVKNLRIVFLMVVIPEKSSHGNWDFCPTLETQDRWRNLIPKNKTISTRLSLIQDHSIAISALQGKK